ncbi:CoA pyrophosphatase [Pseudoalteromonas sp. MMG010]|uniref:CoA pyrophosphatase n=1 Tax=Pseudoalteromonas sp. MMG010 TaxID=2822685 RepID=UPI001B3A368F|nr:CoA pyrophosphatase [Pseudoalteromonas sp. MMG010]MBQ4833277.1 CoA pyrophosphatase [Pseudoalteromonas sp. MMG010]
MNSEDIVTRFLLTSLPTYKSIKTNLNTRASAVIIPIIDINNHAHVLLCKRASHLSHHPGEICLPGGKFEPHDLTLRTTALRELKEELNIESNNVKVLGVLPVHHTLTGFTISPYVALLKPTTQWQNDVNEVQASFLLPLHALSQDHNWQHFTFERNNKLQHLPGFYTPYGLLWGATANIIRHFTRQISLKTA